MNTLPHHPAATPRATRAPRRLRLPVVLLAAFYILHFSFFISLSAAPYLITPITGIRGLEGANVRSSLQTRDGYLWLATSVGLVRYDGLDSVTFRPANTPAFTTPDVRALYQARNGDLWIGTAQSVIRRHNDTFETILALDNISVRAFAEDSSGAIWIGTFGQGLYSWRAGRAGALLRHPEQHLAPGAEYIQSLYIDHTGALWIGTNATGMILLKNPAAYTAPDSPAILTTLASTPARQRPIENRESKIQNPTTFQRIHATGPATQVIGNDIESIAEHPLGTFWFGSHTKGLFRLAPDPATGGTEGNAISHFTTQHGLTTLQVTQLAPAADGGLFIASGGLQKIPATQLAASPDTLRLEPIADIPEERIIAFTEDHENNLWLAVRIAGLLRARAAHHTLINTADGLPGDSVKTISRDPDGNLWLAVRRGGIVKLTPDTGKPGSNTITQLPIPPGQENATPRNDPEAVLAATDGSIWSIWQRQVYLWRDNHHTPIGAARDAFGLYEDRQHRIWVSRENNTDLYDQTGHPIAPPDIDAATAAALRTIRRGIAFHETPDGTLYIGSWAYGLYIYHPAANADTHTTKSATPTASTTARQRPIENRESKIQNFTTTNGLPGDNVRAVYVDTRGNLWVGIRDYGLVTRAPDGRWLRSDALSQALADQVSAIAEDDRGNLWLGTTAGVMWAPIDNLLHSARTGAPVQNLHSLAITDNFQPAPVWVGAAPISNWTPDGRLHFATRSGILSFDPHQVTPLTTPPPVHIENIIADGHPLDMRPRPVTIPAGTRSLTIEYTGLSYIHPDRMTFKYRLDDNPAADWQNTDTSRRVTFADLAPGRYRFQVTARNADGTWNPTPDTLPFTVAPFIYQTLWFRIALPLLLLATLALAILAIYKTRTRRLARRAADLARQNTELETRIQERTLELTLSNTAKSEFLENISHEIRNPLNGITGLIEQLDDDPTAHLTPEQHDRNRALNASARQLNRVFEEILSFSKLEYGYTTLHETRFSLHALLAEIRDTYAPQAAATRNTLTLRLPPAEHHYHGDAPKIRTILDNFITNALKYAPATPITITLTETPPDQPALVGASQATPDPSPSTPSDQPAQSAHSDSSTATPSGISNLKSEIPPASVLIEVTDRGPGVPLDEQELIFKKFARGATARQSGITGAGIGLATCAATARLLNGNVGIDSPPGQGSTFFLKLPLRRAPDSTMTPISPISPISPIPPSEIENSPALIVEDQHYNQIVLSGLLRKNNIPADTAATAVEALAKIAARPAARPYEIILLDIELPDMKGTDLARQIRSRSGDAARPIIIGATAHDSDETRARCLESGMNDYLLKPLGEDTLLRTIEKHGGTKSDPARQRAIQNPQSKIQNLLDLTALELYAAHVPGGMPAAKRDYIDALRAHLADLRAARAAADAPALAQAAHKIRSHAALVGATLLAETAAEIETRARRGETGPPIAPILDELETRAAPLIAQLT